MVSPWGGPDGRAGGEILSRFPHAEVIFDPTGEITAAMDRDREGRPDPRPAVDGPTDATDPVLAAVRRQIVDPVVAELLGAEEIDEVTLCRGEEPLSDDVWVQLVACGEPFRHLLYRPPNGEAPDHAGSAQNLASDLEDFIAESRFAWGEQRIARYELPNLHDRDSL